MERVDDVAPTGVEFILWFSSTKIPLLRSCGLIRFDFQRPGGMVRGDSGLFLFPFDFQMELVEQPVSDGREDDSSDGDEHQPAK